MTSRLLVEPAVRSRLVAHARRGAARDPPAEVCGVLGGCDAGHDRPARVAIARPVPNVADDPRRRYELDPGAAVDALDRLSAAGVDHVGFYHSHPAGPAEPSPTDRLEATWPGAVYAVVALGSGEPTLGAWRFTGESVATLDVDVA